MSAPDPSVASPPGCPPAPAAQTTTPSPEVRIAAILEVALDCIVTVDHQGRFIDFNPAAERTFGYARAEVLGREMTDLIVPPALRAGHRGGMARMLAGDSPRMLGRRIEITAMRADGAEFPVELAITRLAVDGPPVFTAHLRDISERKRTEQELRSLQLDLEARIAARTAELTAANAARAAVEARFRSLFENALEGLYQAAPDGSFLNVNPALARMLGAASPEALLARVAHQPYVIATRRAELLAHFRGHAGLTDFESEVHHASGSTLWISESIHAARAPDGAILHFDGVVIDVTASRETARRLHEAKEAADAANRAKSRFLAGMSHELRTPLNGILGYTQILRRAPGADARQLRGVEVIHQSAEHLLALIEDVLDLSRIEAGRFEINPAPFSLAELARAVESLLLPRALEKGLRYTTRLDPALPLVLVADERRVRQIILNLAGNAVKFTAAGEVTLAFEPAADPARPPGLRCVVADTGPGIAASDLPRLFEPFTQVGDASRHIAGTGLGLAISRSLATALGGRLTVESTEGAGSRFILDIPLETPSAPTASTGLTRSPFIPAVPDPAATLSTAPGPAASTTPAADPGSILLVDDHPANLEVLTELLRLAGLTVETASSGEAALALASTRAPRLVLLDIHMPGLGGLATARELRHRHGERFPIVAVSSSAFASDREAALAAGCNDFLPKPVLERDLWPILARRIGVVPPPPPAAPVVGTLAPFAVAALPPPADEIAALHDLAVAGDVLGLRTRAEALADRDPRHAAFARNLLVLAESFKLKAIRNILAPLLPRDS